MIGKWAIGVFATVTLVFALATTGCDNKEGTPEAFNDPVAISSGPAASHAVYDLSFGEEDLNSSFDIDKATYIALKRDNIEVTGEGAVATDKTLTISEGGTYLLKGELTNGQVIVEVPETDLVQLVLHGVSIHNDMEPSLLIKEGGKVVTTLVADQVNSLSGGSNNSSDTEKQELNGVILSQGDLTINGTGALRVRSNNYGIVSQGELRVTGGKLSVNSLGGGLFAKDAIKIKDGSFALDTQEDSLRAENGEDENKGFIYIAGGNFDIQSQGNGFHAETLLQIDAGNFNITTRNRDNGQKPTNGLTGIALKANKEIILNEGLFDLNTSDAGIFSKDRIVVTGGTIGISSETKGLHTEGDLTITGGILYIEKSHVGISGENIVITGGIVEVITDDDGFIVAGGKDGSPEASSFLQISGGETRILSRGDGLDINGDLFIEGGKLVLSSPVSSGKATFDYGGKAIITGGVFMATGSSVTAQSFSESSTQYSVLHNLADIINAGSVITILDPDGKEILKWTAEQDFCSVQFSSPDLVEGKTYTLVADSISEKIVLNSITTSNEAILSTAISGAKEGNPPMEINQFTRK